MKCPKCGYTSFAYLESCGKCGQGLGDARQALGLYALRPTPLDLATDLAAPMATAGAVAATDTEVDLPSPTFDLSHLDEIGLQLTDTTEGAHPVPTEAAQLPATPLNIEETMAFEAADDSALLTVEFEAEASPTADTAPFLPVDLSQLGDIEFTPSEASESIRPAPAETVQPSVAASGIEPTMALEAEDDRLLQAIDSDAEAAPATDAAAPIPLDLGQLSELELADVSDSAPPPPAEIAQPSIAPPDTELALELETEDDRALLAIDSAAEAPPAADARLVPAEAGPTPAGLMEGEPTLEVEIEETLEIEIDELKLEVDEDDADR